MADLPSSESKINDVEVSAEAALSEALFTKYGSNINELIDRKDDHETRIADNETGVDNLKLVIVGTNDYIAGTTNAYHGSMGYNEYNIGHAAASLLDRNLCITQDGGTYKFEDISRKNAGGATNVNRTVVQDTGITVSVNRTWTLRMEATTGGGGNFFWKFTAYEAQRG